MAPQCPEVETQNCLLCMSRAGYDAKSMSEWLALTSGHPGIMVIITLADIENQ